MYFTQIGLFVKITKNSGTVHIETYHLILFFLQIKKFRSSAS